MNIQSQVTFTDIATDSQTGITYRRVQSPRNTIFEQIKEGPLDPADIPQIPLKPRGAPGVAVFDYDSDGDQDFYVTNGPGASNSLYSNQFNETGEVRFVDVATHAGVDVIDQDSTGVSFGDIDNDGDSDLLVLGTGSSNRLFENQGDGTFVDITAQSNIGGENTNSTSASMGDVNGDGLLDIVIGNTYDDWNDQIPIYVESFARNQPNQLLINQGNNVFEDVSDASGFTTISSLPPGVSTITWAIAMVDYDLDGDIDIFHADDQAAMPDRREGGIDRGFIQLFENDGTGQFTNITEAVNLNQPDSWMGLAFGDLNGDGNLDLFASNLGAYASSLQQGEPAMLVRRESRWFLGQNDGTFSDPGVGDLSATPFGWGTSTFDYDNDADTDIVFHGGLDFGPSVDHSNPGVILNNDGAANFRYDLGAIANTTDHLRRSVQGVAVGDLNHDGFEDIISVSNFDTPEFVPIERLPFPLGSELDDLAGAVSNFIPGDAPGELVWSGVEFLDGTVSVELNSGNNGNRSVAIETLGSVGLTNGGRVNRDGIGSIVFFTLEDGSTAIRPIVGGASYASQDSLIATLGLGSAQSGTVDVLWTGGVRNRLYDVEAGERLIFPEIPVSFDGEFDGLADYEMQVQDAIDDLVVAEVLTEVEGDRFFQSSVRAYLDANDLPDHLIVGTSFDDRLVGTNQADSFDGGLGQDKYIGGKGADLFVLKPGEGLDTIRDFHLWQGDRIALGGGLTFDDLSISRFGRNGAYLSVDGEALAIVQADRFGAINETAFITI